MSDERDINRFAVWLNTKRRDGKKDANWTGTINVEGTEYWINVWSNESDNPKAPVMSGSIRKKDAVSQVASQIPNIQSSRDDGGDIPF